MRRAGLRYAGGGKEGAVMLIECELARVVINEMDERQYVYLKERQGQRIFPIVIGFFEARAIDIKLKNVEYPRPMTHDLLIQVIQQMGGKLEKIVINALEEGTFFARLIVRIDGRVAEIDARPSDALALSVRAQAPIYVDEKVLDDVTSEQE
jgi:uncharacterized protein